RWGGLAASLAAIALTALSTVQFLDPTAHWYGLFLAVATIFVLSGMPRGAQARLEVVGFLIVATFLFRQLSGVVLAMGAVTYLLVEQSRGAPGKGWAGRALIVVMLAGIGGYLAMTMQPTNFVLFGAAPLALLLTLWRSIHLGFATVGKIIGRLAL